MNSGIIYFFKKSNIKEFRIKAEVKVINCEIELEIGNDIIKDDVIIRLN